LYEKLATINKNNKMSSTKQQTASPKRLSAPPTPVLKDNDLSQLRQIILNGHEDDFILRLFGIAETISIQTAKTLFEKSLLANLIEAGLLGEDKDNIFSYFQIQTHKGLVFLSDYSLPQGTPHDLVLPVGPSGRYLDAITIRKKVDSALDLGCGCGIQTLLLALHTTLVTATDINKRCLSLTALNARLNDLHNIELLEGSYFEPVHGRKFDLIVSNTPYVITPGKDKIYRDAKGSGDEAVMNVIQQAPAHLKEGGYAHILATWLHKKKQAPEEPIQKNHKTTPCRCAARLRTIFLIRSIHQRLDLRRYSTWYSQVLLDMAAMDFVVSPHGHGTLRVWFCHSAKANRRRELVSFRNRTTHCR
jgi:SAM-dependent methyltransferase